VRFDLLTLSHVSRDHTGQSGWPPVASTIRLSR